LVHPEYQPGFTPHSEKEITFGAKNVLKTQKNKHLLLDTFYVGWAAGRASSL